MIVTSEGAGEIDGLKPGTRSNLIKAGLYPRPVQLTFRRIGFVKEEVEAWTRERIARRDAGLPVDEDPIVLATRGNRLNARAREQLAA